jgi:regulator of cell morphogenesis and NO signaling
MTTTPEQTIREIVAGDVRTAAVLQRHGIDFCCLGCRTLDEGCREAGADPRDVMRELDAVLLAATEAGTPDFANWDAPRLVEYIVDRHHAYVRDAIPVLLTHTRKISEVYGGRHAELPHIARLFERVAAEMQDHMVREEQILFPFIVSMAAAASPPAPPSATARNAIRTMEAEHEFVGDAMAEIRYLTGGYRVPVDACTTYRVCLEELAAFEADLHAHVRLENDVLFPRAKALEEKR